MIDYVCMYIYILIHIYIYILGGSSQLVDYNPSRISMDISRLIHHQGELTHLLSDIVATK